MVTGQGTPLDPVLNTQLNAIGYNPRDNHFYAWDLLAHKFVKVSSDFKAVTPFDSITGYSGPTSNIFAGDVDEDGNHWFFTVGGSTTTWYQIDLSQPNPTFVASGSTPNPTDPPDTLGEGTDWAYIPGTNSLYRAMDNGASITIVAFNRTSKSYSTVGKVTNITGSSASDRNMGAVYADPDGNFYMSSNGSGILWRVDLSDPSGPGEFTAVQLDAADVGSNDGARCVLASVPTDFGDAPAGYGTLIADNGPRHNVIGFDIVNNKSSLMLGQNVDIENDGLPNADASGDDADHQGTPFVDDERGVQHIVATPGSTDPLRVPVSVTNGSGQAATLVGWIDLDNDGAFEAGERVSTNVANNFNGYKELIFPAPPTPYATDTFGRFRLFAANDTSDAAVNLLPTGPAAAGEAEDVLVQVGSFEATKASNPAEGAALDPGQTVTYTITIENTGTTGLTNLKVDDDLSDVLDDATLQGDPTVDPASAGMASVNGNTLEFQGDVAQGQKVTVTYTVKIKDGGTLGNAALHNTILAAHSANCHPSVSGDLAIVNHPDCQTTHAINGLADTGGSIVWPLLVAGSLFGAAGSVFYLSWLRARLPLSRR